MTTIRKQSIISSGVVYLGFGLGAIINIILTREFSPDQYGLISGMFLAIGTILYSLASFGMPSVVGKFYPYYNDNLPIKKNDLMTWALLIALAGFGLVTIAGVAFRDQVADFYHKRSPAFVTYYFWIYPFALGLTLYTILEYYAWQRKKVVLTNILREVQFRLTTLVLLILYLLGIIRGFGTVIKLYAFNWLVIGLVLAVYLIRTKQLYVVLTPSRVTKKFFIRMRALAMLTWSGAILNNVALFFAQIIIAAVVPSGLTGVGLYTMAQFAGSLIQAPQRVLVASTIGPLSRAWKDKDYGRIDRIYRRSSITQLIFSVGMFVILLINFRDGIITFGFPRAYLGAETVFIFIGLRLIVDMGTGVNSQIIITSTFWRFEFLSGVILVTMTLPLNYWLATKYGVSGPAIADFFTFAVYNTIRCLFLYRKFQLQPFTIKSLYTVLLGAAAYLLCEFAFGSRYGLVWLFIRSVSFLLIYGGGVIGLKLSEDIRPVWETITKRIKGLFS